MLRMISKVLEMAEAGREHAGNVGWVVREWGLKVERTGSVWILEAKNSLLKWKSKVLGGAVASEEHAIS